MVKNKDTKPVLKVEGVSKAYVRGTPVNDDISLTLEEGEIFGLLGPNGAGKTTLVNQIIGLAKPDSGRITIDGIDVIAHPDIARLACSFQAQTQVPVAGLTAMQAIELVGMIRGGKGSQVRKRTRELISALEIEDWANKPGATFSGGVRRLVAYCMAAVQPGRIVILDEPTNDVDPLRRRLLWKQVQELSASGSTVLLVTHNVLEAERAVDRLAIMDKARVIASGRPAQLKEEGSRVMRLEVTFEPEAEVTELPGLLTRTVRNGHRLISMVSRENIIEAMKWADSLKAGGLVEEFSIGPTTLEDVYVRLVGHLDALETTNKEKENAATA